MHTIKDIWRTLKCLPFAILLHDTKTCTYKANNKAQEMFRLNKESHLGALDFEHISFKSPLSKKRLLLQSLFNEYLIPNVKNNVVLEINNVAILLSIKLAYIKDNVLMITFEMEEHNKVKQYNFDHIISNISAAMIDIQNEEIDSHIDYALKAIGTVCHADRSYLFRFNDDGTKVSNTHEWVRKNITSFKDELQNIAINTFPYFFKLMNDTYLFKVNDINALPIKAVAEKHEFSLRNLQSILCTGLIYDNKLVGFIGCDCVYEQHDWTDLDLIRIKLVGEILTNAFKNISYKQKLEFTQQQLITANQKLSELVNTDGLTNIANRRCFDQSLAKEIKRCTRYQQPLSLIICDIDFFKSYNDSYGHQQGDQTLMLVADALQNLCKRPGDLASRYGGEEFAIILPATTFNDANCFAKLIQKDIEKLAIVHAYSPISAYLTLSIGIYTTTPAAQTLVDEIIAKADSALYKAKETGRNKVYQA